MQAHYTIDEIRTWERFYRANFLSSLSGYKSAHLIASLGANGKPNLAIFHNIVHIGADPSLIGFINRPRTAAPHTLANIELNHTYTLNHIQASFVDKAHQSSAKYAEDINEFEAVGLTPQYRDGIKVPFVQESPVQYACELVEVVPIRHNNTFLVIGTITDVFLNPSIIKSDGFLALEEAGSVSTLGLDAYYQPQPIKRLPYAKP